MRLMSCIASMARFSMTSICVIRRKPVLLDGKLAVITGAGAGIGRALAIEAAAHGVCIALFGRRLAPLQETLSKLLGTGHFLIEGDVTSPADRAALMAAIDHRW